jgi:2-polyprenyl-3-methyl-5-hydroxy-6-metoxy-1,4-benzoquinol methylase
MTEELDPVQTQVSPKVTHKDSQSPLTYKGIAINAAVGTHEGCLGILQEKLPPPAAVLDIAAGCGAFTRRLLDAGYSVQPNDLDSKGWAVPELQLWTVDLNKPLPQGLASRQFDAVVGIEVIEHLENPLKFLRDCCSFCRPGGLVILTTPNIVDARSWANFVVRGQFFQFTRKRYWESGHATLLPFWLLEEHLSRVGITAFERRSFGRVELPGFRKIFSFLQRVAQAVSDMPIPSDLRTHDSLCYAFSPPERGCADEAR